MAPDVTVSIVNAGRRDALLSLLASLEPETQGALQVETVVLDNASADGSPAAVRQRFPWARVVEQPFRAGFGANHNRVIRETSGRAILLLSHDAELEPGTLGRLASFLDAHPRAAAVAPRLRYPDGSAQPNAWRFPTPATAALGALTLGRAGVVQSHGEAPRRVGWAMGAALLLRRAALEEVGLFDEGYFMYSEETDLCLRLASAGWETWILPSAVVVHHDSALRDEVPRERIVEEWRSRHRYWRAHHSPLAARVAATITGAQYAARGAVAAAARRVRPHAFDPSFAARMRLHARFAWRGPEGPGLRERAEDWNDRHAGERQSQSP